MYLILLVTIERLNGNVIIPDFWCPDKSFVIMVHFLLRIVKIDGY